MRVAVSIPNSLFRAADRIATRLRMPRSQFYAQAVEAYVRRQQHTDVTERLSAICTGEAEEPDSFVAEAARRTLRRNDW